MAQSNMTYERICTAFRVADVNNNLLLTPTETITAFDELGIKVNEEEAKRVVLKFDVSGDGGLSLEEFFRCIRSPHPSKILAQKFLEHDILRQNELDHEQTRDALRQLGHVFSLNEFNTFVGIRFSRYSRINFENFQKMTCAAVLYLLEEPIPIRPPLRPAGWNEVVQAMHQIFVALLTSILAFFPFKIAETTASANPTATNGTASPTPPLIPFLDQVNKDYNDRWIDTLLIGLVCAWAVTFILSKRARGYPICKFLDIVSLSCALLFLLSLMGYVTGLLVIVAIVLCVGVYVGLACMSHWE